MVYCKKVVRSSKVMTRTAAATTGKATPLCFYNPLVTCFHWLSKLVRYGMADFRNLFVLAWAGLKACLSLLVFLEVSFSMNHELCTGWFTALFAKCKASFSLLLYNVSIDNFSHASSYDLYCTPNITENALFWTLSICVVFSWVIPELHTTAANSSTLRTCLQ